MEYFEDKIPKGNQFCSDDSCPCGAQGKLLKYGEGFLFISQEVVDFRADAKTQDEVVVKRNRLSAQSGASFTIFSAGSGGTPILVCDQSPLLYGMDREIASDDAKYWWTKGLVPLRKTPTDPIKKIELGVRFISKSIDDFNDDEGIPLRVFLVSNALTAETFCNKFIRPEQSQVLKIETPEGHLFYKAHINVASEIDDLSKLEYQKLVELIFEKNLEEFIILVNKNPELLSISIYPVLKIIKEKLTDFLNFVAAKFPKAFLLKDKIERTPAFWACIQGNIEYLKLIVEKVPETLLVFNKNKQTPIFPTAWNGHKDCLEFVIDKAWKTVNQQDDDGKTPALYAARNGRTDCLKVIAEKATGTLSVADNYGDTPAIRAAEKGHFDCLKIIVKNAPQTISIPNNENATPAHLAARNGHIECLQLVIEIAPKTLSITTKEEGITPAYLAAWFGHDNCLKIIAEKEPESLLISKNNGDTPAIVSADNGYVKCLKIIEQNAPLSLAVANKNNETPALGAACNGHSECLKLILITASSTLSVQTNDKGFTPAFLAASWGRIDCLKVIADKAPKTLIISSKAGATPLSEAIKNNNVSCVELIKKHLPFISKCKLFLKGLFFPFFVCIFLGVYDASIWLMHQLTTSQSSNFLALLCLIGILILSIIFLFTLGGWIYDKYHAKYSLLVNSTWILYLIYTVNGALLIYGFSFLDGAFTLFISIASIVITHIIFYIINGSFKNETN